MYEKRNLSLTEKELNQNKFFVFYEAQEIMRLLKVKKVIKSFASNFELDYYVDCEYVGDERGLFKDTFTIPMIISDMHKRKGLKTFDECVNELREWEEEYSDFLKS